MAKAASLDKLAAAVSGIRAEVVRRDRERMAKHFHEYIRGAWHVLEPQRVFVDNWHIGMIAEHCEAMERREILFPVFNVPPGSMKSLILNVFYPSWVWTHAPHERFLCLSAEDSLPIRDSVKCRMLIQSEWYQARWGHLYHMRGDQNEKRKFENDKTGVRGVSSFAGTIMGMRAGHILIDDPHKTDLAESDEVREGKITKFKEEVFLRREDEHGVVAIIMQRLNQRDLAGYALAEGYADAHVVIPMRYEERRKVFVAARELRPENRDPRTVEGELMDPVRFPEAEVQKMEKVLGSFGVAGQLQQRPSPRGGGIITRSDFRFYRQGELPEEFDMILDSWDCAFKDTKHSAYVAGGKWGIKGKRKYLLRQVRERMTFRKTLVAMVDFVQDTDYPTPNAVLVEDKANGPAVIDTLTEHVSGLIAVEPRGSKIARAESVTPQIEAGECWVPDPNEQPWVEVFLDEWCSVPGNAFWDQVDQTSQALDYAQKHQMFDPDAAILVVNRASHGEKYLGGINAL